MRLGGEIMLTKNLEGNQPAMSPCNDNKTANRNSDLRGSGI